MRAPRYCAPTAPYRVPSQAPRERGCAAQLWASLALAACWTVVTPSGAPAQTTDATAGREAADAEMYVKQGIGLRRKGRDAEALELFKQAARLNATPRIVAQMGLAEQALGRWVDAEWHLELALKNEDYPWIRRHRETLKKSLALVRKRVGAIELLGGVPGADIAINGRVVGRMPLRAPVKVEAGSVVIEARMQGYHLFHRQVHVGPGALARETITLIPVPEESGQQEQAAACAAGQLLQSGHCCWPGQIWSEDASRCTGVPACPSGLMRAGEDCVKPKPVVARAQPPEPKIPGARLKIEEHIEEDLWIDPVGAELGIWLGYGSMFDRIVGVFAPDLGALPAYQPGPHMSLYAGYRPVRWVSFGLQAQGNYFPGAAGADAYWNQPMIQAGTARAFAGSVGLYLRGHTSGTKEAGTANVWLLTGVHPLGRFSTVVENGRGLITRGVVFPFSLGLTLQARKRFGVELAASSMVWLPTSTCRSGSGPSDCFGRRRAGASWHATLGFSWF
ncbi:MAG: hypothetical protein MJD61_12320 [Proteobacteria bacterium]|nr:hypothetical protein [Pseudomonadota bacterium]